MVGRCLRLRPSRVPDATAFLTAIKSGQRDAVRAAIDRDPRLATSRDEQGLSATLLALYQSQPEIAADLAERAGELDVFEASAMGRDERVRWLVSHDSSVMNAYGVDGFTALGLAAFFKRADIVQTLLAAGADASAASRNAFRFTPLHSALATNAGAVDIRIVRALIDAGADVNARSGQGTTALHTAAYVGHVEAARCLLDQGADATIRSSEGKTALDVARERGNEAVARLLA